MFHVPIEGSTTDIGFKFDDGFSLDRFDGLDVVLAGDIHKRQVYDIGNGNWGWGNNELEYYRTDNATVENGLLTITAKQ